MNYEAGEKKEVKNNIPAMRQKLVEMQTKLNWVERLDLVNGPAPLAPELAYKEELHSKERASRAKQAGGKLEEDVVHNDFKREMLFYRQAQAAVLEGLPRLQSLGVKTKRPDDYFAQMAKSDQHMNKIRAKLLSKEQEQERAEKIKKLRELKKYGKKVQVEVQQKRQKEKKEMLEEMKKMRKGQGGNMDNILDKKDSKGKVGGGRKEQKRNFKDKKFGFGGKKRDVKKNDKRSTDDVSSFRPGQKTRPGGKGKGGAGSKGRPGKGKRQKMKNRKKA